MENINDILLRHFEGTVTPGEEAILAEWRKQNPEEYAVLKKAWLGSGFTVGKQFNSEKAWSKVSESMGEAKVVKLPWLATSSFRIAATLFLFVSVAFALFFLYLKPPAAQNALVFENKLDNAMLCNLPDSSKVWLNKDAKLSYIPAQEGNRELSLTGEAFFEVKRDPERPFVISATQGSITVLGTSFNVKAADSACKVSVYTGTVNVQSGGSSALLTHGQSVVARNGAVAALQENGPNDLSWKSGEFVFDNTSLQDVVNDLNTYYKNRFVYKPKAEPCFITARFDRNTQIKDIESIITTICDLNAVHQNSRTVFE